MSSPVFLSAPRVGLLLVGVAAVVVALLVPGCSTDPPSRDPLTCGSTVLLGTYVLASGDAFGASAAVGVGIGSGWYDPGDTWTIDNPGSDVPIDDGSGDTGANSPSQGASASAPASPGSTGDPGANGGDSTAAASGGDPGAASPNGPADPGLQSLPPGALSRRVQSIGTPPGVGITPPSNSAAGPPPISPSSLPDGCYGCSVACVSGDASDPSAEAARGVSAQSHDDACANAVGTLGRWAHRNTGKPLSRCRALPDTVVPGAPSSAAPGPSPSSSSALAPAASATGPGGAPPAASAPRPASSVTAAPAGSAG